MFDVSCHGKYKCCHVIIKKKKSLEPTHEFVSTTNMKIWILLNFCWNGVKCAQRLKVGQTTKQVTIKSEQWMVYVLSY